MAKNTPDSSKKRPANFDLRIGKYKAWHPHSYGIIVEDFKRWIAGHNDHLPELREGPYRDWRPEDFQEALIVMQANAFATVKRTLKEIENGRSILYAKKEGMQFAIKYLEAEMIDLVKGFSKNVNALAIRNAPVQEMVNLAKEFTQQLYTLKKRVGMVQDEIKCQPDDSGYDYDRNELLNEYCMSFGLRVEELLKQLEEGESNS